MPPMQGCSAGAGMLSILAATAARGGQGFWKPVGLATQQSAKKVSINMFWQRTCRLATQGEGRVALGNSGRVLPAQGQWQSWLGIPYQSGSPHSLFQVHILDEYNGNLAFYYPEISAPLSDRLLQDAGTGQPCPGEILEPMWWPLASDFELLLQSPNVGPQKERLLRLLSIQGRRTPSRGFVFHNTKHPSSCATEGSGPSTPAKGLWESTGISGSTGLGRSRGEGSPALVKSEAMALGKQGASSHT